MSEEFKSTIIMNEQRIFRCILENPKLIYELQPNWFSCAESNKLYKTLQYLYENHLELTPANIATKSGQTAYLDAPPELFPDVEYNTVLFRPLVENGAASAVQSHPVGAGTKGGT